MSTTNKATLSSNSQKLGRSSFLVYAFSVIVCAACAISALVVAYIVLFTQYYWIVLVYFAFCLGEGDIAERGGRPWIAMRSWRIWEYARSYFPAKIIKTSEFVPKKNHLVCMYPHGVIPAGVFINFGEVSKLFPDYKFVGLTLSIVFKLPVLREIFLCLGGCSVSQKSLDYLLGDPKGSVAVIMYTGGSAEAVLSRPGMEHVLLKNRKGFIKTALRHGACLVPVYTFGESDVYDSVPNPEGSLMKWIQDNSRWFSYYIPVIPRGCGFLRIMPNRVPITTVAGKPIEVDKVLEPTNEQIDELHAKFVTSLQNLFDEWKHKCVENADEKTLIIS